MTTPPQPPRRPTRRSELARRGEDLAAVHFDRLGYRIEAQNLRTRDGEIDLLVRSARLFVAVEVKTRTRDEAPERSVSARQLERVTRALLSLCPVLRPRPSSLRVDVVAVRIRPDRSAEVLHFAGREFLAPPC